MQTSRCRQNQPPPKAVLVPAQKQKVLYWAPRKSRKARNRIQSLPRGGVRRPPLQLKVHQNLRLNMPQIPPPRRLILQHVHHVQQLHSEPAAQPVPQGRRQQLLRPNRKFPHLLKRRHALHLRSVPAAQQDHPVNLNQTAGQRPHQRQSSVVMPQEPLRHALHRLVLLVSTRPSLALPRTGPLDQAPLHKGRPLEQPRALIPLVARQHSKRPIIPIRRLDPSTGKEGRRPHPIVLELLFVPERHALEHHVRLHQDILRQPGQELDPPLRLSALRSDEQPL